MPSKRKPKRRALTYAKYRDVAGKRMVAGRSENGERNHGDEERERHACRNQALNSLEG